MDNNEVTIPSILKKYKIKYEIYDYSDNNDKKIWYRINYNINVFVDIFKNTNLIEELCNINIKMRVECFKSIPEMFSIKNIKFATLNYTSSHHIKIVLIETYCKNIYYCVVKFDILINYLKVNTIEKIDIKKLSDNFFGICSAIKSNTIKCKDDHLKFLNKKSLIAKLKLNISCRDCDENNIID